MNCEFGKENETKNFPLEFVIEMNKYEYLRQKYNISVFMICLEEMYILLKYKNTQFKYFVSL